MRILLTICLFCLYCIGSNVVLAQEDKVWPMAEYMPSLPGCETMKDRNERRDCTKEKISQHLVNFLKYPTAAEKAGEEGVAVISFVVRKDGEVTDMVIEDDPGFGMGDAAMKAVKRLNKVWQAGEHMGEMANVRMKIPVQFDLPKTKVDEKPSKPASGIFTVVDDMPAFKGCGEKTSAESRQCTFQKVMEYTNANMKYPDQAKAAKVEGTVRVRFVIDEEGNVTSPSILEGIGGGCDEEALRVLNAMPQWKAGRQDGQAVKVEMELPFKFRIRGE